MAKIDKDRILTKTDEGTLRFVANIDEETLSYINELRRNFWLTFTKRDAVLWRTLVEDKRSFVANIESKPGAALRLTLTYRN